MRVEGLGVSCQGLGLRAFRAGSRLRFCVERSRLLGDSRLSFWVGFQALPARYLAPFPP